MKPRIGARQPGSTQSAGLRGIGGPAAWPGALRSPWLGFLELEEVGDGGDVPHTPSLLAPGDELPGPLQGFVSLREGDSVGKREMALGCI